jgi:stage V sporulation protein D (sporulation-specific penicillin-binding protein)
MQPYIIKEIIDNNGNIVLSNGPQVVKQTVSQRTSDILCEYLEYTVEHGKMAYLEGYRIAGKTGTSEKLDSLNEEGQADKRIASFIGFAPADDPQVCVLVIVDEPNSEVRYGSAIAAPLAKKVLAEALDHLNIEPDYGDNESTSYVDVPHVRDLTLAEAKKKILAAGLVTKVIGNANNDAIVTYQLPGASKDLPTGATVVLFTDNVEASRKTEVPNLIGLTAAEANRQLLQAGLNIRII